MYSSYILLAALVAAAAVEGAAFGLAPGVSKNQGTKVIRAAAQTCLAANALQTASDKTGQEPGTVGIEAGQAPSATDPANFINFCAGKTLTNGGQNPSGSCNGIPMGEIPDQDHMVSTIITSPAEGEQIPANQTFNVTFQTQNINLGFFVNADAEYYAAPQQLTNNRVNGHSHVTIQEILSPQQPPDPRKFAFFKGLNDAGDNGLLTVAVEGGLPPGSYRACTMNTAANHQNLAMPVAKRGFENDCQKFKVVDGGNGNANKGQVVTPTPTPTPTSDTNTKGGKGQGKAKGQGKNKDQGKPKETNSAPPNPTSNPCP